MQIFSAQSCTRRLFSSRKMLFLYKGTQNWVWNKTMILYIKVMFWIHSKLLKTADTMALCPYVLLINFKQHLHFKQTHIITGHLLKWLIVVFLDKLISRRMATLLQSAWINSSYNESQQKCQSISKPLSKLLKPLLQHTIHQQLLPMVQHGNNAFRCATHKLWSMGGTNSWELVK